MMTILLLMLHMNNDPSSGIPFSKPVSEDSLSSRIVVPTCVHSVIQPQDYKGNDSAMNSVMECQVIMESIWYPVFEVEITFTTA